MYSGEICKICLVLMYHVNRMVYIVVATSSVFDIIAENRKQNYADVM